MSLRWFILTLTATLCLGATGVLQKIHQTSSYKDEMSVFLIVSHATATISAFMLTLLGLKKDGVSLFPSIEKRQKAFGIILVVVLVVAGVCTALCNVINLYLAGAMDSAVFFPVFQGGSLMLITLLSIVLYKEKLSLLQWVGLCCGAIAVVCLCL